MYISWPTYPDISGGALLAAAVDHDYGWFNDPNTQAPVEYVNPMPYYTGPNIEPYPILAWEIDYMNNWIPTGGGIGTFSLVCDQSYLVELGDNWAFGNLGCLNTALPWLDVVVTQQDLDAAHQLVQQNPPAVDAANLRNQATAVLNALSAILDQHQNPDTVYAKPCNRWDFLGPRLRLGYTKRASRAGGRRSKSNIGRI